MERMLKGQTAVVTGGASGLGLAITKSLVQAGAHVAVIGSRSLEQAGPALRDLGADVSYYSFDLQCVNEIENLAQQILRQQGGVQILVNNAGNHCKKYIWDMTIQEYQQVLNLQLTAAFALTKAFVPQMKQAGYGRILFQASMTSYIGQPQVSGYATAKAGYLGLVHTLTAELAEYGITVNAIAPGWIDTPMFRKATDHDAARFDKIMNRIPAKRLGKPEDIGMCAAFLCSPFASYINGTCIPVDGGALIGF